MKQVKIRITGMEKEALAYLNQIRDRFTILSESKPYPRRNSRESSIYAEVRWEEKTHETD